VRNPDADLRSLERRASAGDQEAQERYYYAAARAEDCDAIGSALLLMGPARASAAIGVRPGGERDRRALCLGLHLVGLGYLADIPVVPMFVSVQFATHMVSTKPSWIHLPTARPGRSRRRRFRAVYGFNGLRTWGHEIVGRAPTPTFRFDLKPLGKHFQAEEHVRSMGLEDAARRIAPAVQFLARWDRSHALARPWADGAGRDVAGGSIYWIENNLYGYRESDPSAGGPYSPPDQRWRDFLRASRAGYIPGEAIPPRAPAWSPEQVEAWLLDPERVELLRALFYADLWLAGLLVPGDQVDYDPVTGGPAARSNPWW
jgi:hypothetical protein